MQASQEQRDRPRTELDDNEKKPVQCTDSDSVSEVPSSYHSVNGDSSNQNIQRATPSTSASQGQNTALTNREDTANDYHNRARAANHVNNDEQVFYPLNDDLQMPNLLEPVFEQEPEFVFVPEPIHDDLPMPNLPEPAFEQEPEFELPDPDLPGIGPGFVYLHHPAYI